MKKIIVLLVVTLCTFMSACSLDDVHKFIFGADPRAIIETMEAEKETVVITEPAPDAETYEVVRVVDGDTFVILDDGEELKVRLIGIDTPESVHPDSNKNCSYGKVASEYAYNFLNGKDVVLEYDKEKMDYYDRLLAYVYVDGEMLNYTLIEEGYAVAKEYPPNTKYADIFTDAQITAQHNEVGMWNSSVSDEECNLKKEYYIN